MLTPNTLWSIADMLELPVGVLMHSYSRLHRLHQFAGSLPPDQHLALEPTEFEALVKDINDFLFACQQIGLGTTESAILSLLNSLNKVEESNGLSHFRGAAQIHFTGHLSAVVTCFHHEITKKVAFVLSPAKVGYFAPTSPLFGIEVRDSFPLISHDISEAGKCLALGRATAVVFHLMRILEAGLRATHRCLGIEVELEGGDRNWGRVLARIRTEIRERGNKWAEMDYFKEIFARLDAIKDAWRNLTMHIENVYTEEGVAVLFDNTRALMQRLALRMNEQGIPKS